jgi:hypothetical protein
MSTPSDGSKPRMNMYLWGTSGGPYVDSSFDPDVILHEYTHGVFRRLILAIGGVQGGAMNEGNSDFFALNYLTPPSASTDGSFPAATYSKQNFIKGIRTRPYSTDFSVNDLTYADFGRVASAPEVHADGGIWVEAMWELRARLIKKYGYEEGRRRGAQLMINAMKRSPANPSFVDMRDSLISADQADHAGEDIPMLWEAFARRGLGYMAVGGTGSSQGVRASQELPSPKGRILLLDDVSFLGETIRAFVGDSNNPDPAISLRIESSGGDSESIMLARSGTLYRGRKAGRCPDDGAIR